MYIRKGTASDIDELEALYDALNDYLAAHENYPGWRKGVYPTRVEAEEGILQNTLYAVIRDGRIAGTFILNGEQPAPAYGAADWGVQLPAEDVAVIHTFAAHPDCLGLGVGSYMLDFILRQARAEGRKAIRLDTYEKNLPASRLYEKFGFQYIGKADLGYAKYGLNWYKLYQLLL